MPPPVDDAAPAEGADDVVMDGGVGAIHGAGAARPARDAAALDMAVPGGYLKHHQKSGIIVAHCLRHGERACRLTRSVRESRVRGREGQGRPLGYAMAWLAAAEHLDDDTADAHKGYVPSYDERVLARVEFAAVPGCEDWLAVERPQREEEGEEPEVVP